MAGGAAAKQKAKEKRERKAQEAIMKQAKEKVDEGRTFLEPEGKAQVQYAKAVACFESAITLYADGPEAYLYRGNAYRDQKEYDKAIEDYTRAISLQPDLGQAVEGRAYCFESKCEWDKAIEDYTVLITLQPDNDHAHSGRGLARLSKRVPGLRLPNADFAAVVDDLKRAIQLNENNFYACCCLGQAYVDQKMYKQGIAEFKRATELKDDYFYAFYRRGLAVLDMYTELEAAREEKERRDPVDVKSLSIDEQLALEDEQEKYAKEKKTLLQQAIEDFKRVVPQNNPEEEITAVVYRAMCHMLLAEYAKAEDALKQATKMVGSDEDKDTIKEMIQLQQRVLAANIETQKQ